MIRSLSISFIKLSLFGISVASFCIPCHAQLSGEVDLAGGHTKSEAATEANIKEITVTAMGETLESAEKQALAAAIRQAVGAYIDSKTIVENEEVIQDRILTVSNAFVEKYEVVGQPKKSSDGLIEITILAKVKTNQVVQALKENNLISGEVAGQNLWAEASTKVLNAQDAVAMLEAKFPELTKSVLTMTPLDKEGNPFLTNDTNGHPQPNTAPAIVEEDPARGKATLTWFIEYGVNKSFYNETYFPLINKCLTAIFGTEPEIKTETWQQNSVHFNKSQSLTSNWINTQRFPSTFSRKNISAKYFNGDIILVKRYGRDFSMVEYCNYPSSITSLVLDPGFDTSAGLSKEVVSLKIEALDENGETIAMAQAPAWQPIGPNREKGTVRIIGPNTTQSSSSNGKFQAPQIDMVTMDIPIDNIKDIKKIDIKLEPQKVKFYLR